MSPCPTDAVRVLGASTLCLEMESSADVVSEGADVVCVTSLAYASETGRGIGRASRVTVSERFGMSAMVMDTLFMVVVSVCKNCDVSGSVDVTDTAERDSVLGALFESTGMPVASALNFFHTFDDATCESFGEAVDHEFESVSVGGADGSDAHCCSSVSVLKVSALGGTSVAESYEDVSDVVVVSVCE